VSAVDYKLQHNFRDAILPQRTSDCTESDGRWKVTANGQLIGGIMKKLISIFVSLAAISLLLLACGGGDESKQGESSSAETGATSSMTEKTGQQYSLLGHWQADNPDELPPGEIEFRPDHHYTMTEFRDASTRVTREGEYRLDASSVPNTIDLCLGDCEQPGAEFVTLYGIFKFDSADKAQIEFSSTDRRPTAFASEPNEYTLILTRSE
jgi:hypothetical protein